MTGQAASRTILSIRSSACSRALAESDQCDVGSLAGGDLTDVRDVDLARDHLVSERDHDRSDERQAVLALVGDQDAQMIGVEMTHQLASVRLSLEPHSSVTRRPQRGQAPRSGLMIGRRWRLGGGPSARCTPGTRLW